MEPLGKCLLTRPSVWPERLLSGGFWRGCFTQTGIKEHRCGLLNRSMKIFDLELMIGQRKMVGARGFELCPFTPNCPIFKELQNQRTNVHTLFTDSSEKPLKIIKTAEEEK